MNTGPTPGSVSILAQMYLFPKTTPLGAETPVRVGPTPGLVLYGPYLEVPAGWHTLTVHYQARPRSTTETRLFGVDITAEGGDVPLVPSTDALLGPEAAPDEQHAFSLTFCLTEPARLVEAHVLHHGLADLVIHDITFSSVPLTSPPPEGMLPARPVDPASLAGPRGMYGLEVACTYCLG